MRKLLPGCLALLVLCLNVQANAAASPRTKVLREPAVSTASQRQEILAGLKSYNDRYDPAERMPKSPYSSPGYHTTLRGGFVHSTRGSLEYAVALLDGGDEELRQRAEQIIDRVVALQDQNPQSKTYGIWSWFLEEPLDMMSPPDWNWADFCGHALLQALLDHRERLSRDLVARMDASVQHAARSIQRRNVGSGYTNIAILGTYVTMVAAEMYDLADLREYAQNRLKHLHEYTLSQGGFTEYNSPTYTIVSLMTLSQLRSDVRNPESLKMVEDLHRLAWEEIAQHFHPPTWQWAGPHSRSYSTLLRQGALQMIKRATEGRVDFGLSGGFDMANYRVHFECPRDLEGYFTRLDEPRMLVKPFTKGERAIIGSTYLHPKFALGSVNRGDMWNQRRALVGYWGTAREPRYLHVRLLHDGYDFAAAQFFSVQDKGRVLAAINFAIDGGDTHPSLDRIKNGTIRAKDLRLSFELGGESTGVPILTRFPEAPLQILEGGVRVRCAMPFARFGEMQGPWKRLFTSRQDQYDVVLYHGPEKEFRLADLPIAALGLAVELTTEKAPWEPPKSQLIDGRLKMEWGSLVVDVPARPDKAGALQAVARMRQK